MNPAEPELKTGVLVWNQYTDWNSLLAVGAAIDELGYDSLWTWDHLYPIVGDPNGPIFEGYLTLAAWGLSTRRVTIGLMVGANTFRNPALVAKMVTTLDHLSAGRAVLGIGGAWFEEEHTAFGIDFGSGFGERLDRLDEAAELIRGMLGGGATTARPGTYQARNVRNDPGPVQRQLPILIGGGGERKTLATVARYADAWNIGGSIDEVRHKEGVLRSWCETVGRDHREIERTLVVDSLVIRDDIDDARAVARTIGTQNGGWEGPATVGSPKEIAETLSPYVALGFRHLCLDCPAPYDRETLERFQGEVKPLLETVAQAGEASEATR